MESSRLVAEMGLNVTSSAFSAARWVDIMSAEEWVQWHAGKVPRYYIRQVAVYVPIQYVSGSAAPFIVGADGPDRALFTALNNLIAERRVDRRQHFRYPELSSVAQ